MKGHCFSAPDLSSVRIIDSLFGHYIGLAGERILPYQWAVLNDSAPGVEPSHCVENFRIAAGDHSGQHSGVVFIDSDLYKWLEALAYCISAGHCRELEPVADEVIGLIGRAQCEDGYLNTYYTLVAPDDRWQNLVEGHELYCSGHFIEAAVAYYKATGKREILDIACKNADLIYRTFGHEEGKLHGYPGHQEIELALVKLYRVTGEKKYLDCARYFISERGSAPNYFTDEITRRRGITHFAEFEGYDLKYSQAHRRPVEQKDIEGHAVRAMYMCSAMADIAAECDDADLLDAAEALWDSTTSRRMYITGGIGSSGFLERFTVDYDLPNDSGYCESCASIGLMMFGQRMNAATGKAHYYDAVERALYNTVLAGISVEGDRYFYVNPLEMIPQNCMDKTSMRHVKPERQGWFSVACCPPNILRTLSSLGQYIYAEGEGVTAVNMFISSVAHLHNDSLRIGMESGLVSDGRVVLDVSAPEPFEHTLLIRVPDYAGSVAVAIDGVPTAAEQRDGYIAITRLWHEPLRIEIDFDISPMWVEADINVHENIGKVALVKGPCVYCLEETDNVPRLGTVYISKAEELTENGTVEEFPGDWPVIEYNGWQLCSTPDKRLYCRRDTTLTPVRLRAIPYCFWNNRGIGEMIVWQKLKL